MKKVKKVTHCVVYRSHKGNSPTVIDCYSEDEQNKELSKIQKEGYKNAYKATPEQAMLIKKNNKVLNEYGKLFDAKPLTEQERWHQWASGK
jgi:hypothetical protein